MMGEMLKYIILFNILNSGILMAQEGTKIPVIFDGVSIQEPGVFLPGCYYGDNESISDHAPVLYKNLGTWNIAGPINQYKIQLDPAKPESAFYNHKFRTDDDGNLINRQGTHTGFVGSSEVMLLKDPITADTVKNLLKRNYKNNLLNLRGQLHKAYAVVKEIINSEKIVAERNQNLKDLDFSYNRAKHELENKDEKDYLELLKFLHVAASSIPSLTFQYVERMKNVASKIREIFKKNNELMYMVLQETPDVGDKTVSGENLRALIKEFYEPKNLWMESVIPASGEDRQNINSKLNIDATKEKLKISFYRKSPDAAQRMKTALSKTAYKGNLIPDVAIVSRLVAPKLTQELADHDNRFVSWCSKEISSCFVSVHMPFSATADELIVRCKDIKAMTDELAKRGYKKIQIAGDFNTSATRVSDVCSEIFSIAGNVELHTSPGEKGNSCGSNQGHVSQRNIDIMITFRYN